MEVRLLAHTINPEETVAVAGKGCYSAKPAYDIALTPVGIDHTLGVIHPSCYEHAVFTFSISGISRVTSHQLVRHRMASYSQQSQRYVKPKDLDKEMLFEYITPESVSEDSPSREQYEWAMKVINKVYKQLLGWGCPEEDARYLLPNACTTNIVVTMNARELQHFCGLRRCTRAQWEIRELAEKMAWAAEDACPELFRHFSLGPQCEQLGYCPEHKGCGKYLRLDQRQMVNNEVLLVSPEISEETMNSIMERVKKAMEETAPIVVSAETRETVVTDKTRTAEEYREDGYEDLARQKEREEDAVAVAKSVVEKPDVPRCPKCGSRLDIDNWSILVGRDPRAWTVGCPKCGIWCENITKEKTLDMFMRHWGKDE